MGLPSVNPEIEPDHSITLAITLNISYHSEIRSSDVTVIFVSTLHKKYNYELFERHPNSNYNMPKLKIKFKLQRCIQLVLDHIVYQQFLIQFR
jgi:hypothetical protein